MRVGTSLPQRRLDRAVLDVARECEDLGYHSLSVFDHLVPLGAPEGTPALEAFTTLAAVAAVTSRIGLRTLVARAAARPPAMTAHLTRTLHALAGGRFVLALGLGDASSAREDALLGQPHLDGPARRDRLRETVAAVREMVADATIWVGGYGAKTRALAVEVGAAAWNVWALRPEEVAHATTTVGPDPDTGGAGEMVADATTAGIGGAVGTGATAGEMVANATVADTTIAVTMPVTWGGQVVLGATAGEAADRLAGWRPGRDPAERARVLSGTPDEVVARLRALEEAGVVEALVAFVGGDAAEQRRVFAREVLPVV